MKMVLTWSFDLTYNFNMICYANIHFGLLYRASSKNSSLEILCALCYEILPTPCTDARMFVILCFAEELIQSIFAVSVMECWKLIMTRHQNLFQSWFSSSYFSYTQTWDGGGSGTRLKMVFDWQKYKLRYLILNKFIFDDNKLKYWLT